MYSASNHELKSACLETERDMIEESKKRKKHEVENIILAILRDQKSREDDLLRNIEKEEKRKNKK